MTISSDLYHIPIQTIQGKETTLEPYRRRILLIVNVASRCGFTPQYRELQQLHEDYQAQGLTVLGFPCNQFLHQEPADNQDIQTFASSCFRVTFPLFAKLNVRKPNQAPLYAYLAKHIQKKPWILVPWNFTKILVDQEGRVLKRYLPMTPIKKIRHDIDCLIKQVV